MRVTLVGGGSLLWAFGISRQFVASELLEDVTLTLMDIDAGALDLVATAVGICNEKAGAPVVVEKTTDRGRGLDGADFVIVSISTGGLDAMCVDVEIPEKYGIWQPVGDTVGPGGWSRAVRNIPVFRSIAEDMKRLCPDAWLVNVSNPLSVLTRVPAREFGVKSIGQCPGVEQHARALARLAGLGAAARLDHVVTGIDHGSWFTSVRADGVDVLERLREMGYCRSDGVLPTDDQAEAAASRAVFAVWAEIGYMPAIGDRHAAENWPWFLARSRADEIPMGIKRTSITERREQRKRRRKTIEEHIKSGGEADRGAGHGDDPILQIVESLSGLRDFIYGTNYANIGQTPELPPGAVVETRARYDACGVNPFASPLPPVLQAIVAPQVIRQEAVIDIALGGSFDELVALVRTDPLCSRLESGECREMMREMLEANRKWIANPKLLEFGPR